jgi:hypothetical protein
MATPLFDVRASAEFFYGVTVKRWHFLALLVQFYLRQTNKTNYDELILSRFEEEDEEEDYDYDQHIAQPPVKKRRVEQSNTQIPAEAWIHVIPFMKDVRDVFNVTLINPTVFHLSEASDSLWTIPEQKDYVAATNKHIKAKYKWLAHKLLEELTTPQIKNLFCHIQKSIKNKFPISIYISHDLNYSCANIRHNTALAISQQAGDHYYEIPSDWKEECSGKVDNRGYHQVSMASHTVEDVFNLQYTDEERHDMERFLRMCYGNCSNAPKLTYVLQTQMCMEPCNKYY